MTIVVGTDEAGYGPNLGPLVVAATVWRLDCRAAAAEATLVGAADACNRLPGDGHLWGDSKTIYKAGEGKSGDGLAGLERGVLAGIWLATGSIPADRPALAAALGQIDPPEHGPSLPAGREPRLDEIRLPGAADSKACLDVAEAVRELLQPRGVTLAAIVSRAIHPAEFNSLLDSGLNKSDILSRVTLELAAAAAGLEAADEVLVWCDRHGGRKAYASLVARHFNTPLVQTIEETPRRSAYALPASGLQIEFCVGGEERLPVALASMTAKYVRELSMRAFNACWSARLPGLAPTAGYPLDARRWMGEAATAVRAAGIPESAIWRRC